VIAFKNRQKKAPAAGVAGVLRRLEQSGTEPNVKKHHYDERGVPHCSKKNIRQDKTDIRCCKPRGSCYYDFMCNSEH
jgi:hypothetical protein